LILKNNAYNKGTSIVAKKRGSGGVADSVTHTQYL